jgi:hypothetical protein
MKSEEAITAVLKRGASPLGSHASLDEFALAYPTGRSQTACAQSPRPCWSMPAVTSTVGRRATRSGRVTWRLWRNGGGFSTRRTWSGWSKSSPTRPTRGSASAHLRLLADRLRQQLPGRLAGEELASLPRPRYRVRHVQPRHRRRSLACRCGPGLVRLGLQREAVVVALRDGVLAQVVQGLP